MNKYGIATNEIEKLMDAGCPCGDKTGGSNFFAVLGDYAFYCNVCKPKIVEKFLKRMEEESYDKAAEEYMKGRK